MVINRFFKLVLNQTSKCDLVGIVKSDAELFGSPKILLAVGAMEGNGLLDCFDGGERRSHHNPTAKTLRHISRSNVTNQIIHNAVSASHMGLKRPLHMLHLHNNRANLPLEIFNGLLIAFHLVTQI